MCLADVLDRLADGRPGPEEAWALVQGTTDQDTVCWTTEMAEAWAAARFVLDDRVAGRMAFLETYRDRLAVARSHVRPPAWQIYLGYNTERRQSAVLAAVEQGKITPAQAMGVLPEHEWLSTWRADRILPEGGAIRLADVAQVIAKLVEQVRVERAPILPEAEEGSVRDALETQWRRQQS